MTYLLDTCVVSETVKGRPDIGVVAYLSSVQQDSIFISDVTIAEIRYGILMAREPRRLPLEQWLENEVRTAFSGRILPVSEAILLRWRVLMGDGRKANRTYSQPDLFLAATALEHDLTLVTRNVRDFADIPDLQLLNPWEPAT